MMFGSHDHVEYLCKPKLIIEVKAQCTPHYLLSLDVLPVCKPDRSIASDLVKSWPERSELALPGLFPAGNAVERQVCIPVDKCPHSYLHKQASLIGCDKMRNAV